MADFRKWLPVLAVLALLVAFTTQAAAQTIACTVTAGSGQRAARSEGITELVGDVDLACTNDTGASQNINIQIYLSTDITSRLISSTISSATLLGVTGGSTYAQAANVAGSNTVVWQGVPIAATGTTLRITNVRANATQAGVSASNFPSQIAMLVTANGAVPITLTPTNQVNVATVQKGLGTVGLTSCTGGDSFTTAFQQCTSVNNKLPNTDGTGSVNFNIKFSEGFSSAFKVRTSSTFNAGESGTVVTTNSGVQVGLADSGTRLVARFANIPAGVAVFVTTSDTRSFSQGQAAGSADLNGTTKSAAAVLVSTSDATGSTGTLGGSAGAFTSPVSSTAEATCSGIDYPVAAVALSSGAGTASWEIVNADPSALESVSFGISISYTANQAAGSPALASSANPGTVVGGLAPISTAMTASTTGLIPRFTETLLPSTPVTAVTISSCVTNLLFPFVTNQLGFDTGIALANTSSDGFKDPKQAGACTLSFFGATTGGGAAPAAATTPSISTGTVFAFTLGMGGSSFPAPAAGFQGYMIAQCQFQFAHGFAFVTNGTMTQGYLGLVLPSGSTAPSRVLDSTFSAETLNQ